MDPHASHFLTITTFLVPVILLNAPAIIKVLASFLKMMLE